MFSSCLTFAYFLNAYNFSSKYEGKEKQNALLLDQYLAA